MLDTAWVALSLTGHIGKKKLDALLKQFGNEPRAILEADMDALQEVPGVGPTIAANIRGIDLEQVEQSLARWREAGVEVITLNDPRYPVNLRAVDDAPPTLFMRGRWRHEFDWAVSIVGTRTPTPEAVIAGRRLGEALARQGYTIVSGLALGIDSVAHAGALAVEGGHTVAILGGGVLNVYPHENQELAEAIIERGALLCEARPDAAPNAASLVARNRIISGLSKAVIVVETGVDGGAMHAARRALEQGRRLYVIDNDAGGNRALLMNDGALVIDPRLGNLPILAE